MHRTNTGTGLVGTVVGLINSMNAKESSIKNDTQSQKRIWASAWPLLLVLSALWLGCNRVPKLVDYPEYMELRDKHPQIGLPPAIVAVGSLGEDVSIARSLTSHWDPKLVLELRKVHVRVENVLRGRLASPELDVFYFTFAMTHDGPPRLGNWYQGKRRLLFLQGDSGVLRMACDGVASCARVVKTGYHPSLRADPGTPLAAALAELFLTKGERVSDSDFASAIVQGESEYEFVSQREFGHVDHQYAVAKLWLLSTSNVPAIRKSACDSLELSYLLVCESEEEFRRKMQATKPPFGGCVLSESLGQPCEDKTKGKKR
jgi:hypothetical protein